MGGSAGRGASDPSPSRRMPRDEILLDVLRGLLIAGAVALLVLFAPSGEHVFIYQGF